MTADGLLVEDLQIKFGGLVAVNGLTLKAPRGTITGLIGPNGAGKSTTFNACAGLVGPARGSLRLDGRPLNGLSPMKRARCGLGRTFQRMELMESLPVRDNVALAAEALDASRRPWGQLTGSGRTRSKILRAADAEIERCGLEAFRDTRVSELSTGQRRLVELARVLTARFNFLLLDEPASGLDAAETEALSNVVAEVVQERGIGVLLVEHDMTCVRQLCSYIYVLDFGELIFEGEQDEVFAASEVRSAYLGKE